MISLEELFRQAGCDHPSSVVDSDNLCEIFTRGVKAIRYADETIKFFDTTKGGGDYAECTDRQYWTLKKYGWTEGVRMIAADNYCYRIDLLDKRIRLAIIEGKNANYIDKLKSRRDALTASFARCKRELNQIT